MKRWIATAALTCALTATAAMGADQTLNVGGVDQEGATIKGIVKFEGRQANRRPVRMASDAFCAKAHPDNPPLDERFVFGDNDTLQNVFVYVSGKPLEGQTFPAGEQPVIDQEGCVYTPHVSGVVAGQSVVISTSDAVVHNVRITSDKNGNQNFSMLGIPGLKEERTFEKPEMGVKFQCDVHPWMNAYVHVMPHPFFAVTQQEGTFEIKGLPAGEYEVSVWHEFDKFQPDQNNVKVTVGEGEAKEVNFIYAPPQRK